MSERSRLRLVVLQVLVISLLLTLVGRLYYLQVVTSEDYTNAASSNTTRKVVTPAPRGQILDSRGRALASNKTELVVSVDRSTIDRQPDDGKAVLQRVAQVVGQSYAEVYARTRLCSEKDEKPDKQYCWNGLPYVPIPVSSDADDKAAQVINERSEDFPGVTAQPQTVREYPEPQGAKAPHELGYLNAVTPQELEDSKDSAHPLQADDLIGRGGLEKTYDADLRGVPGTTELAVDKTGAVTGTVSETAATPGNIIVSNIDASVQAVVEKELANAIKRARTTGDVNKHGKKFTADSGAAVVMDVRTGAVIAMASYPSYDPNVWVGGISPGDYTKISTEKKNYPIQSRAFQGEFAPGSIFKVVTLPGALQSGYYNRDTAYDCPSSYKIGNTRKKNYESEGYGVISLKRAIQVSCDTVFYKFAYEQWQRDGGIKPVKNPKDPMLKMAHAYHLGQKTGVDLPAERTGRVPDRAWKKSYWEATKATSCLFAKTGYPNVEKKDPTRAAYLKELAKENCVDGYQFRAGDAANFAIGQGDALVTPLQMATVYSAVANGGTLWEPHVAKAIVQPDGTLVRTISPKSNGKIPVTKANLAFLQDALASVTTDGTGRAAFASVNFPVDKIPVASKTGTAEVYGKESTSWFATYAPANDPQYAIVMMVSQGGTGSGVSGPSVAAIYSKLFGVDAEGVIHPEKALQPGSKPPASLPTIRTDGTVCAPADTKYKRKGVDVPTEAC